MKKIFLSLSVSFMKVDNEKEFFTSFYSLLIS